MAFWTREEYRVIILYNFSGNLGVDQSCEEISPVLGPADDPQSGRLPQAVTPENIAAVKNLLNRNKKPTYWQIE